MPRILPSESTLVDDAIELEKKAARIFIVDVEVKKYTIPKDVTSKAFHNLYSGFLPKRCTIVFTANDTNKYAVNGLEFKHFGIKNISLIAANRRFPTRDYFLDWSKK